MLLQLFQIYLLHIENEYMYYALTNYHVIKDAAVIKAFLGDKDIEYLANELAFYLNRKKIGVGGAF